MDQTFIQLAPGFCSQEALIFSVLTKGQWRYKNKLLKKGRILKAKVFSDHPSFVFFVEHRPGCFCASKGLEHSHQAFRRRRQKKNGSYCNQIIIGHQRFKAPPPVPWTCLLSLRGKDPWKYHCSYSCAFPGSKIALLSFRSPRVAKLPFPVSILPRATKCKSISLNCEVGDVKKMNRRIHLLALPYYAVSS